MRVTTNEVRTLMAAGQAGEPKSEGEIRQIIDKVNRASDNLEHTLKNLDGATGRLDRGEGTLGRLSKDDHLINQVEGVADDIGDFRGWLVADSDHRHAAYRLPVLVQHGEELRRAAHPTT